MEIWKDIEGFEGYQVSNHGRVRTYNKITSNSLYPVRRWKNRILKLKTSKRDGRVRVCLWKDGREYTLTVHRLVAIAFLGTPEDESMTVNHKDGDPSNNMLSNLEWMSKGDNIRYGFTHGQYSTQKSIRIQIKDEERVFRSYAECDRFLGRYLGYISDALKNNRPIKNSKGELCVVVPF